MRGPLAPVGEDPFLAEMRGVFFAACLSHIHPFCQGAWEVKREFGHPLFEPSVLAISYAGKARWTLQFMGWYAQDALACLKAAMKDAAGNGLLQGGRGTPNFPHKGYLYKNNWGFDERPDRKHYNVVNGHFEAVYNPKGEQRGWGRYQAMLLPGWNQ